MARQLREVMLSLNAGDLPHIEAVEPEDERTWSLVVRGPEGTPYAKGLFGVKLIFNSYYPREPPIIKFSTPIFHPNVHRGGQVCWRDSDVYLPACGSEGDGEGYSVLAVLGVLNALLHSPNPHNPSNHEAAVMYLEDKAAYVQKAKALAEKYAFQ